MTVINKIRNYINQDTARKVITTLGKEGNLLPVILLEGGVTGGRTLQAQKRGGYVESRERFCEESITAVIWLFGVRLFNELGNFIGKHILKIPITEFDVGKDALRTPFANVVRDLSKKGSKAISKKAISKEALAGFKFGKIILSVIAATSFIGFGLPKINQSITRKVISRKKAEEANNNKTKTSNSTINNPLSSIEEFKNKVTNKKLAFKGIITTEALMTFAHNLENDNVYKLLSTDTGIFAGRAINARNNTERIEFLFRDLVSIYFYMFCTKHVIKLLKKIGNFGKLANLDPVSANKTTEHLKLALKNIVGEKGKMHIKEFQKMSLGSISSEKMALLNKLPFDKDVISLKELVKELPKELLKKAAEMSKLQPSQAGVGRVLTKQQVEDILKEGKISDAKFLIDMNSEYFGKNLTNPYKYIPMKDIQSFRNNIDDYVKTIIEYAEKHNKGLIDINLLEKMNKHNLLKCGGFFGTGFLISALFLSTIIPKTQYLITKLRTGKNEFPGMENDGERKKLISKSK